jgi:hypothetical protein
MNAEIRLLLGHGLAQMNTDWIKEVKTPLPFIIHDIIYIPRTKFWPSNKEFVMGLALRGTSWRGD